MPRHERDTQVPSSTNNESYQSETPNYPDHITAVDYRNTSLEEAVEKGWIDPSHVPDVVPDLRAYPARMQENAFDLPSQQPTQETETQLDKEKFWTFGKKLGATTLAALAVAGGVFGIKAMSDTPEPKTPTQETSLSIDGQDQGILDQEVVPIPETVELTQAEIEAASSEYFTTLDTAVRINSYGPKLEEWRDGAYENLLPHLSESEKNLVSNEFPSLKTNYSDQDILNQYAIDLFDATSQGNTTEKINQGRKLHAVFVSPKNVIFNDDSSKIGNGMGAIESVSKAISNYPRIYNTEFKGNTIGSTGAQIIEFERADGTTGVGLFTLLETSEGNSVWQYTGEYASNENGIDKDIANAIEASRQ